MTAIVLGLNAPVIGELESIKTRAMMNRPGRTVERAKGHLHKVYPTPEEALALKVLDQAWIECQREAGR